MKNYFLDMDGTIAMFPDAHGETGDKAYRLQAGFFKKLKPFKNIEKVNQAIENRKNQVFIISNSPTMQADIDKQSWLKQFLPAMSEDNIIFNRGGLVGKLTKSEVAKIILGRKLTEEDILIDDYAEHLKDWMQAGGKAILKKTKGKKADWEGEAFFRLTSLAEILTT